MSFTLRHSSFVVALALAGCAHAPARAVQPAATVSAPPPDAAAGKELATTRASAASPLRATVTLAPHQAYLVSLSLLKGASAKIDFHTHGDEPVAFVRAVHPSAEIHSDNDRIYFSCHGHETEPVLVHDYRELTGEEGKLAADEDNVLFALAWINIRPQPITIDVAVTPSALGAGALPSFVDVRIERPTDGGPWLYYR